tara:strand:- start:3152 stop:3898 length:747 start_codon:yes stop_codon:yes gene_type:complete
MPTAQFNLSTITCPSDAPLSGNSTSKIYKNVCNDENYLLDTPKKHNSIRSVKEMMIRIDSNDLSSKQRTILTAIKQSFSPLSTIPDHKIAAVLFDMKALGDITQFEYFIENIDLFESFETHDTLLLLLAIICTSDKNQKRPFNQTQEQHKSNTYLHFATYFNKGLEKVPLYYKLSINDLIAIYNKICELIVGTPQFNDNLMTALKVFARILDSCHDFLKDKTNDEADEDEAELLTIEHYLNSIFEPAD